MIGATTQYNLFENNTISGNVVDAGFSVGGASTEVVGNSIQDNRALYFGIHSGLNDDNVIESNTADYDILIHNSITRSNVSKNTAHRMSVGVMDASDVISSNTMADVLIVEGDTNFTIVNNTAYSIQQFQPVLSDVTASNLYADGDVEMSVLISGTGRNGSLVERTQSIVFDGGQKLVFPGIGNKRTTHTSSIAFSGLDAGEISAITDNVTAVAVSDLKTTAVSAAQAVTVQAQIAALTTALAGANAAALAAASVANSAVANITALTARVNTLTSGFCALAATVSQPPASLASLMSLTGCVTVPPAPATTISGQDNKDLLALLVLLAIPAAAAVHFVSKYRDRLLAEQAARVQAVGGGKAQAVDVIIDAA